MTSSYGQLDFSVTVNVFFFAVVKNYTVSMYIKKPIHYLTLERKEEGQKEG